MKSLTGKIRVIHLPDLDEQYAAHQCNFLSWSRYAMQFRDGWELVSVNAEVDSTAVAIEILNVVDKALKQSQAIQQAAIRARPGGLPAIEGSSVEKLLLDANARSIDDMLLLQVTEKEFIPPGLYRVNKPWEVEGDVLPVGCGLLAKMGLPIDTEVQVGPAPKITPQ